MGYLNGKHVLPPALLTQVQQYVQGECIYIPRSDSVPRRKRRRDSGLSFRNSEICRSFSAGVPARQLAEEYHLSVQAIYKILAGRRK